MCLYHDHAQHDWDTRREIAGDFMPPVTEGPARNPVTRQRSLYTTLLDRLAELVGCPLSEVVSRILDDVEMPDHSLAWLSLAGKERLIQGLDLEYVDEH